MRTSLSRVTTVIVFGLLVVACASTPSPAPTTPSPSPAPASFSPAAKPSTTPAVTPSPTPSQRAVPTWTVTDSTATPHGFHTATPLGDGRVLVAGGVINDRLDGQVSASAEVYDSSTASWASAAEMLAPRWGHTATLLADGRVLVAGSHVSSSTPLASAELYDPITGSWSVADDMGVGRGGHTATLLSDGTVLVAGGYSLAAPDGLASAELYDPRTGSWTATPNMGSARQGHTATLLSDGTVLVVGGGGEVTLAEGPPYGATAELYDSASGRWTATGSMTLARFGHSATRLPNGTVLVVGGSLGDDATARSAELYDPSTGKWTATSSMAVARSRHTATLLVDGSVLVAGGVGLGSESVPLVSAELFDPASAAWVETTSMVTARDSHTATLLPDGLVLVLGDYDYESRAAVELFDPGSTP